MDIQVEVRKESLQVHSMLRRIGSDLKKPSRKLKKTIEEYALWLVQNETALQAFNYYLVRERNPAMYEPDLSYKLYKAAKHEKMKGRTK